MDVAYLVRITGRVTGVGFRYSALRYAENLPTLRGYIRNVSDNRVEAVVQGSEEQVKIMLKWLRHGPAYARVDDYEEIVMTPAPGAERFSIR